MILMYNFTYVPPRLYKPVKKELIELIKLVQDEVREDFTFQYNFIGSSSRNMITRDKKTNVGYDFDVDLIINDRYYEFDPEYIKNSIINALNKHKGRFKYNKIENSKRVITIKSVDHKNSRIKYSCDFALVRNYIDDEEVEGQEYIFYNKKKLKCEWQEQTRGFYELSDKVEWIKENSLWNEVRIYYLEKKNRNTNHYKKSRSLYAEAVNDIYYKYSEIDDDNETKNDNSYPIMSSLGLWARNYTQYSR